MGVGWGRRKAWPGLLVALAAVAGAVVLRLPMWDSFGPRAPFVTFYPAVILAALFGGVFSGLVSTALLSLVAALWVLAPGGLLAMDSASLVALGMFLFSGTLISCIIEALHQASTRALKAESEAALAAERGLTTQAMDRLAALVENSYDAIVGKTMEGVITSWNSGAESIYGYSAAEAVGQSASMLCPAGCSDEVPEILARIRAGERVKNFETTRQRKDGSSIQVSMTMSAVRGPDGSLTGVLVVSRDITERKRAEAALRESETFLRTIIECSPDCVKVLNSQGELTFISQGGLRLLDLEDASGVLGRAYADFWRGTALVLLQEAMEEARAGSQGRFQGYCPTARGRTRWWDVSISPLLSARGEIDRFLVISRDDTVRKETQEALLAERDRLFTILNTTQDLMFLKDRDFRYLAANAAHEALLGMRPEDMLGRTDFEIMPENQARLCRESDEAALRDGSVQGEEQWGERWFRVSKKRVQNAWGEAQGVAALITDITPGRRAFEALRESEERFRRLVENAPDAIFVQTGGAFAYVNPAWLKLYGARGPEEVLGQPVFSRLHPDFHAKVQERVRRVNEGTPQPPKEERHLRLDGSVLDAEVSAMPLVYNGQQGALVFVRNIAARKQAQALHEDLERMARHDLKAPLNGIINLPLVMLDEGGLSSEQAECAELIHRAGLRMLDQINLSLNTFQIEQGVYIFNPEPVDLLREVRLIAEELSVQIKAKRLVLECFLGQTPAGVTDSFVALGEQLLMRCLLENLLVNAVEASPSRSTVRVVFTQGQDLLVRVENEGEVDQSIRDRFFERYVTHGKQGGTGLGTYSARLMAKVQGGDLLLDTSRPGFTTLTVLLPRTRPQTPQAEAGTLVTD